MLNTLKNKKNKSITVPFLSSLLLIRNVIKNGGSILFTGFSGQQKELNAEVQNLVKGTDHFYINEKGLGSLITNFSELKKSISNTFDINYTFAKKKKFKKNVKIYSAIQNITKRPNLILVFDVKFNRSLIIAATNVGIPVILFDPKVILKNTLTYIVPLSLKNKKVLNKVCMLLRKFII